jgi:hypothetical protein
MKVVASQLNIGAKMTAIKIPYILPYVIDRQIERDNIYI